MSNTVSLPNHFSQTDLILEAVNQYLCTFFCQPNHNFTGQAQSSKRLTSIVHIVLPETDNCPSPISRRERMTIENISWSISTTECFWPGRGLTFNRWIISQAHIHRGRLPEFISQFVKGDNSGKQDFASSPAEPFQKLCLLLKERICLSFRSSTRP